MFNKELREAWRRWNTHEDPEECYYCKFYCHEDSVCNKNDWIIGPEDGCSCYENWRSKDE